MGIELVEKEIQRFLSTSEPEAICLSGRWGVGKTFAWNKYIRDAQKESKIDLQRYAYVSLFGINSLEELKYSIFENSVKISEIDLQPSLETLTSNFAGLMGSVRNVARKVAGVTQKTPFLSNYLGGLAPIWYASVTSNIVCIDDLERCGKNLEIRDILGLINNLKEVKKCKVCLILNDEELEHPAQSDFKKYLEKVIDTTLKFAPSPMDCARIALAGDSEISQLLSEHSIKLGISNIRVIKKIERLIRQVEPLVASLDKHVLRQAVHTLTLLGWSAYEPANAPPLEYLEKKSQTDLSESKEDDQVLKNATRWNALLQAYGFGSIDEFDQPLLQGIHDGYFNNADVKKRARQLDEKIKAGNLDAGFNAAWRMFHDSFDDNAKQVLDAMHESFLASMRYISPMNMNSTIVLFKELGRKEQALDMLQKYIQARKDEAHVFDLSAYPFAYSVNDPDVVNRFNEKYASLKSEPSPRAILLRISENRAWNEEDISILGSLRVDQYRALFEQEKGGDHRSLISACLMFDNMTPPEYSEIAKRAKEALRIIGNESAINALRIKALGVKLKPLKDKDS